MLWFRRQAGAEATPAPVDEIIPAELPLAPDGRLFRRHFDQLLEGAEQSGGIENWLAALGVKQRTCATVLEQGRVAALAMEEVEQLLDYVFTARRHLYPALQALGRERVSGLLSSLLCGSGPLAQRMQDFVDAMPGAGGMDRDSVKAAARVRRAAWDFAAELVHFRDPVKYPLMSRWVWDRSTQSGALREFVYGNDAMPELPFDSSPELFEGMRRWLAARISEQGIYRDVPLWIDLTAGQAYVSYFRALTDGSLGADFGRGAPAHEQLRKLLGIDAPAGGGRSRVKKAVNGEQ
jgi:hypothetical protein